MPPSLGPAAELHAIAQAIHDYKGIEIARTATHPVPGSGSATAQVVFIGEAPGAAEDLAGQPFVGRSGIFLTEMLSTIGWSREEVFITNIVKYRPPNNRDPTLDEISACSHFLDQQLAVIHPRLIVTLGRHSMHHFLPNVQISEVHGQPHTQNGRTYVPLYHPAVALYNGSMRHTLIDDFAKLPKILEKITKTDPSFPRRGESKKQTANKQRQKQ